MARENLEEKLIDQYVSILLHRIMVTLIIERVDEGQFVMAMVHMEQITVFLTNAIKESRCWNVCQ